MDAKTLILNNVAKPLEEFVLTMEDLEKLLAGKEKIAAYCGYEPSGPIHIGYFPTIKKMIEISRIGEVKVLLADYHAYLNDKGPLELLQEVSVSYWIPVFRALGVDAKYILGSEFQESKDYIHDLFTLARFVTVQRAIRAVKIILRRAESISVAASIYPIMQVLDMVHLGINLAVGGTDQRKIHALARDILHGEVSPLLKREIKSVVCIHLPMILGLKAGEKMSSSKPETHIAAHDKPETIVRKLQRAYCPPTTSDPDENPIFSILAYIIFPYAKRLKVDRPEKYGGPIEYESLDALRNDFLNGKVHPLDLKNAVAEWLIKELEPVRKILEKDPEILRPIYRLQKWNFEKGYISKESWEDLQRSYQQWLGVV